MLRVFSTFSGVGGFEQGLENAFGKENIQVVGYSEFDTHQDAIYKSNFPTHKAYGDITKIDFKELPDFDLLVGGVPCQSWSIAGNREGFEDARGTMWYEYFRCLKDKQPKYFIAENVKGLISHDGGKSVEWICESMCELGYVIDLEILNSKYFGVPQNRERIFIVGTLAKKQFEFPKPIKMKNIRDFVDWDLTEKETTKVKINNKKSLSA